VGVDGVFYIHLVASIERTPEDFSVNQSIQKPPLWSVISCRRSRPPCPSSSQWPRHVHHIQPRVEESKGLLTNRRNQDYLDPTTDLHHTRLASSSPTPQTMHRACYRGIDIIDGYSRTLLGDGRHKPDSSPFNQRSAGRRSGRRRGR
jgi:hypothetical protein